MDPAIVFFGFGVGFLVGLTGMGGGSLMTPLLILVFGVKPVTAIGTDIFYAALTKTAGGWRHLKHKTVNMPLTWWMAAGSVPSAIGGVYVLDILQRKLGDDLDSTVFAILASCLLVVGAITLMRSLFLADKLQERDNFEIHRRHKIAAIGIGTTTGFLIGLSSAGSGTVIAIMLIAVFRLTPQRVVGTDVFHAAILLWAAGIAHIVGGNVDFMLAGNILIGSIPGVILGSNMSVKWPQGILRTSLGVVLIAAGVALLSKANTDLVPYAIGVSALIFVGLFVAQTLLRREVRGDPDERAELERLEQERIERDERMERELARRAEEQRQPELAGTKK
jgi:uncharacterized membrane protein YfcA